MASSHCGITLTPASSTGLHTSGHTLPTPLLEMVVCCDFKKLNRNSTPVALPATRYLYTVSQTQYGGGEMAFWQKKQSEREQMDEIIRRNPGIRQAELARRLDVARSTVARRLPSMEEAGYLYAEDDRGGLWPFKRTGE